MWKIATFLIVLVSTSALFATESDQEEQVDPFRQLAAENKLLRKQVKQQQERNKKLRSLVTENKALRKENASLKLKNWKLREKIRISESERKQSNNDVSLGKDQKELIQLLEDLAELIGENPDGQGRTSGKAIHSEAGPIIKKMQFPAANLGLHNLPIELYEKWAGSSREFGLSIRHPTTNVILEIRLQSVIGGTRGRGTFRVINPSLINVSGMRRAGIMLDSETQNKTIRLLKKWQEKIKTIKRKHNAVVQKKRTE